MVTQMGNPRGETLDGNPRGPQEIAGKKKVQGLPSKLRYLKFSVICCFCVLQFVFGVVIVRLLVVLIVVMLLLLLLFLQFQSLHPDELTTEQ